MSERPTPASDETHRLMESLGCIWSEEFNTWLFWHPRGWTSIIQPDLADCLAAAVQAESRKLLEYAFTRTMLTLSKISDDKVTLPPGLAGQSMQWRQGYKIGMSRLADAIEEELARLDSEQQKLGGK